MFLNCLLRLSSFPFARFGLLFALFLSTELSGLALFPVWATLPPNLTTTPAKPPNTSEFDPLNPDLYPPDPLLPLSVPLSPFQRRRLREALDKLNLEAQAQADAGNQDGAFEIWYRELRARRILGALEEINALGRVGGVAWEKTRKEDVARITKRLEQVKLEQQGDGSLPPEILTALAQAYQKMRSLDEAIAIYQQMRVNAKAQKNLKAEEQSLSILGELYLAKFDYTNAAIIYEDLLARSQARKNAYWEGIYLQKLAKIYSKSSEPSNAIRIKEQLVKHHIKDQKIELISDLKIALGEDYEALNQPEKASQNYQEAYSLSWSLQQFGAAGLALKKLANLYQVNNQPSFALQIYQKLLRIEQQSYNYYGLMKTYEQVAQLYRTAKQYQPALIAYQQSLALARSLKYQEQEDYLLNQIQLVNSEMQNKVPSK